ncbi:hypothetical protein ElyMa_003554900 [Elysia marginata]|uniref:Uncharacterized protein n=1 Tax=Elysia marginata TaxID=1093978 RepID=A0AAV4EK10_9GAST|nr:hypothetical protein ElyMa_003554900 [Elysia marginata]
MRQTLKSGGQIMSQKPVRLVQRSANLESKRPPNPSILDTMPSDKNVKVRTQLSCSASGLNKRRPRATSASTASSSNGDSLNKDSSTSIPLNVNPYRNVNLLSSSRTRKNVFFSESDQKENHEDSSDTDSDDAGDAVIRQVRRANGQTSEASSDFLATSPVIPASSRNGCNSRRSSASPRTPCSPQVIPPTSPISPSTPRPGTSRQRKPLSRQKTEVKTEDNENDCGSPRSRKHNASKNKSEVSRRSSNKNSGPSARDPRRGRPRCISTASIDDAVSSSGSSASINSPRGPGGRRRLHSSRSSVETPPPGTARSSGTNANSVQGVNPAWSMFENHVKLIDDCTSSLSNVPRRTFMSSPVFQNVMTDLYGRPEYSKTRAFLQLRNRVGNVAALASRFLGRVKALHAMRASSEDFDDGEDDFDFVDFDDDGDGFINGRRRKPSAQTVENAKRAWKILRNHVMEEAAKKRMSRPALAWDVIRHTLRAGSNLERARLDIYQRYGLVPMVLPDGRVVQENTMLSERARQALANKPQKPATYSNPRASRQSLSTPSKRTPYKSIEGFGGYSRSDTM